jgi:hypothetical protein
MQLIIWRSTSGTYGSNPRQAAQFTLIAGDTVSLPFDAHFGLLAAPAASQSFSESTTFELQYLPEPSASLGLPSGLALLAMLAHNRAR